MRIVSGTCRGRSIVPPKNLKARPTTDFAKENLFNILNNKYDFDEMAILDLFSGTGSISYEFASRGAGSVTSVEINSVHHDFIVATAKKLGLTNIYALKANVFLYIKSCKRSYDIVFADPPYDLEGVGDIPELIISSGLLKDGGILIFEHGEKLNFWEHPSFCEVRTYGSVHFSIFKQGALSPELHEDQVKESEYL